MSVRIIMTLSLALLAELLLLFHVLLILAGKGEGLASFLQVFLPAVGVYSVYSFSLIPRNAESGTLRAALLLNPAGTVLFAGVSIIFFGDVAANIVFAILAGFAFVAGLWLLVLYFRKKKS